MTHLPTGDEEEEYMNPFVVELAKTGRSTCGSCKTLIAAASLRLGQTKTTPDSSMYGRTFWKHLGCVTASTISSVTERLLSIEAADGFGGLKKADKKLVLRVMAGEAAALAEAREAHRLAAEAGAEKAAADAEKKAAAAARKAERLAAAAEGDDEDDKPAKKAKKAKK